jgi:uncharacterized protein YutE (UPF0331/DUF86 family)/predicted nucleotidyltransferase
MNISETQINEIKNYLSNEISPYLIILFGSAAKGSMTPDSDIDIAFLSDKKIEPYELFMIAQKLADKLGRDVDLVNLETASTVFKAQVVAKGKVIFDNDSNRRLIFQMNSFKEYATLNEQGTDVVEDVLLNKTQIIKRCIKRINDEYANDRISLDNYTKQDSIVLNIQRACEACIDLAMYIVSERNLGVPQNSRDAFDLMFQNNLINEKINSKMKSMVGFRNIAVHDYRSINLEIIQNIITKHLDDFKKFADIVINLN